MLARSPEDELLTKLRNVVVSLVRHDGPDLTARQLSVLLTIYLVRGPHTVRGLATLLNVDKSAVTRGLDRLAEFDFTRRKGDPKDRRSILVVRTARGMALLREMRVIVGKTIDTAEVRALGKVKHLDSVGAGQTQPCCHRLEAL